MISEGGSFAARIAAVLPKGWFSADAPVLGTVLQGVAATFDTLWSALEFTSLQTRVSTATGAFLDMAARDFCGGDLSRLPAETDSAFRVRLLREP
ncbi:hypothetical protein, partial [Stenotrophomonas sp. A3_2]|uniref:hypothetical protein n=1 Tax=Stenotrophomonas sp. A3_2 TaxID=3119978 RepID=UPI002FC2F9C7